MELTWLGTAGFEFKTGQEVFLVDPFLSGNEKLFSKQEMTFGNIKKASRIFISHGHFDHIMGVSQIAFRTKAKIYCSSGVAEFLRNNKVKTEQIYPVVKDKEKFKFQKYTARAFFCSHIRFDKKLIISTLKKTNVKFLKYLPLFRQYRCGQVFSWRFQIEGRVIQFFGSAGATFTELEKMADKPIDILLLPLQGHSDICEIGLNYVKVLKPGIVIPHHFDDFYPPISKSIDIRPFVHKIKRDYKKTRVVIPEMKEKLHFF